MKRIPIFVLLVTLTACAHLPWRTEVRDRAARWEAAHRALAAAEYAAALSEFEGLIAHFPDSREGREALFYAGSIQLDPRSPGWNPRPAEELLRRYVQLEAATGEPIHRRPEGEILLELARQLNLPPQARVPGLQPPEEQIVIVTQPQPTRIAPAGEVRALAAELEQLRSQLAARNDTIRAQREELERIRRALRPRT